MCDVDRLKASFLLLFEHGSVSQIRLCSCVPAIYIFFHSRRAPGRFITISPYSATLPLRPSSFVCRFAKKYADEKASSKQQRKTTGNLVSGTSRKSFLKLAHNIKPIWTTRERAREGGGVCVCVGVCAKQAKSYTADMLILLCFSRRTNTMEMEDTKGKLANETKYGPKSTGVRREQQRAAIVFTWTNQWIVLNIIVFTKR